MNIKNPIAKLSPKETRLGIVANKKEKSYKRKKIARPHLTVVRSNTKSQMWDVVYPVSRDYNGVVKYDGKPYKGFEVGQPYLPKGFTVHGIGVGLNYNVTPPQATKRLVNNTARKYTTLEVKELCRKAK